jgi:hypothetical protein
MSPLRTAGIRMVGEIIWYAQRYGLYLSPLAGRGRFRAQREIG